MLTRYHSDSPPMAGRSLDDNHHPVLITVNNIGLLTFTRTSDQLHQNIRLISARSSEMIFSLLC